MSKILILLLSLVTPIAAMAQGPACSEAKIRDAILKGSYSLSDDAFFWSGAYDKPLIGKTENEEGYNKLQVETPRKYQSKAEHPQRIVVSKSGDMAYEYGTGELSFDELKTGKHIAFQNAYLRVWKAVGGNCLVAATMVRPIDSTVKETSIDPKKESRRKATMRPASESDQAALFEKSQLDCRGKAGPGMPTSFLDSPYLEKEIK